MTTIAPTSLRSRQTAELMVVSTLLELMPLGTPNLSAVIYLDAAGSKDPKCHCCDLGGDLGRSAHYLRPRLSTTMSSDR